MAETVMLTCDNPGGKSSCSRPATRWNIWRDGDKTAVQIDLCDTHSKSLMALVASAPPTSLPSRPRAQMELTTLRTTSATAGLKRK